MLGLSSSEEVYLGFMNTTRHFCGPKHTAVASASVDPYCEVVSGYIPSKKSDTSFPTSVPTLIISTLEFLDVRRLMA